MGSISPLLNASATQTDPRITTGPVALPQLPGRLHWFQSCAAFWQLPAALSPRTTAEPRWCWGMPQAGMARQLKSLTLNSPGVLERCFMSKTVPKSKASFTAVSQECSSSAPVAITCLQERREATGGKWAADREEPTGSNCPVPHVSSCYFSSSWWSFKPLPIHLSPSKLKQQLLAVDGEPKARRTTQTCKSCKKCN